MLISHLFLKAARKNRLDVVRALLEAGADPNLQGKIAVNIFIL